MSVPCIRITNDEANYRPLYPFTFPLSETLLLYYQNPEQHTQMSVIKGYFIRFCDSFS